jgi:hypothetical protein
LHSARRELRRWSSDRNDIDNNYNYNYNHAGGQFPVQLQRWDEAELPRHGFPARSGGSGVTNCGPANGCDHHGQRDARVDPLATKPADADAYGG